MSSELLVAPSVHLTAGRLSFGGEMLFDGLDVDLAAGRTTALLGPSGVGKTTLIRLLAGLQRPEHGSAVSAGDGGPVSDRAAWMAQTDLLLPWASLLDNVLIGHRLRNQTAPVERARALLAEVGLAGRENDRPATLSGGMRQRAALVRTLLQDRPIILMDEPFSALDPATRLVLQDLAARLLVGRTVLLVTHDPLEALRLAHRVLVLGGRPARIVETIEPAGAVPRPVADPALLADQARLLQALAEAAR